MSATAVVQLLAGGVGGSMLTVLTRRVEFRREDRARWLLHREEAYSGFLSATVSAITRTQAFSPSEGYDFAAFSEAIDGMSLALGRVRLLASEPVLGPAVALFDVTFDYVAELHGLGPEADPANRDPDAYRAAAKSFRQAARLDLGVDRPATRLRVSNRLANRAAEDRGVGAP